MCLGVPGQVVEIEADSLGMTMGKVSFAGVTKRVCLAYAPEVRVGDYVVVHVGFAIARIDEAEALAVFETLKELGELAELDVPQPAEGSRPAGSAGGSAGRATRALGGASKREGASPSPGPHRGPRDAVGGKGTGGDEGVIR